MQELNGNSVVVGEHVTIMQLKSRFSCTLRCFKLMRVSTEQRKIIDAFSYSDVQILTQFDFILNYSTKQRQEKYLFRCIAHTYAHARCMSFSMVLMVIFFLFHFQYTHKDGKRRDA